MRLWRIEGYDKEKKCSFETTIETEFKTIAIIEFYRIAMANGFYISRIEKIEME
jgi:hypothetical protein